MSILGKFKIIFQLYLVITQSQWELLSCIRPTPNNRLQQFCTFCWHFFYWSQTLNVILGLQILCG